MNLFTINDLTINKLVFDSNPSASLHQLINGNSLSKDEMATVLRFHDDCVRSSEGIRYKKSMINLSGNHNPNLDPLILMLKFIKKYDQNTDKNPHSNIDLNNDLNELNTNNYNNDLFDD